MIAQVLFSLFLPLLIGYFLSSLLVSNKRSASLFLIRAGLTVGFGFGTTSCFFFVWSLFFSPRDKLFVFFELGLLFFLGITYWQRIKKKIPIEVVTIDFFKSRLDLILTLIFLILVISSAVTFVLLTVSDAHGSWDAWAIWNMRARFIFRGGENWLKTFSDQILWSHPDYPLLLPGLVARSWALIGKESLLVSVLIAGVFGLATLSLLMGALFQFRSKTQSLLSGVILLGTPMFVRNISAQYADIPLGFFILSSLVLFFLAQRNKQKSNSYLVGAGLMLGFSVWTKNEGLLFMFSFIFAFFMAASLLKRTEVFFKHFLFLVLGVLPFFLMMVYFRTQVVYSVETTLPLSVVEVIKKFFDLSRYWHVSKSFFKEIIFFGEGIKGIVPLMVLYLLLIGLKIDKRDVLALMVLAISLVMVLGGFFAFYMITPYDLQWHLNTSLDRLFLQLWPSFLFLYFMMVKTPET